MNDLKYPDAKRRVHLLMQPMARLTWGLPDA